MASPRQVRALTRDSMEHLPATCRACTRWELDAVQTARVAGNGTGAIAKADWLSTTLLEWGSCGQVMYVDERAVGYVTYAPAAFLPGLAAFATSPIAVDAVGLAMVFVDEAYRGRGCGRALVRAAAADLARRGVRAIEVVASEKTASCMVPAEFLRAVGFCTVRAHPINPRLRLDLKSTVSWREDVVEVALDRIRKRRPQLGTVRRNDLN